MRVGLSLSLSSVELVELVGLWRGWLYRARAPCGGGGVGCSCSSEADCRNVPRLFAGGAGESRAMRAVVRVVVPRSTTETEA